MIWRRKKREVQAPEPVRPQGVRVERADGTVLPVELVYEGLIDGLHRWVVTGVVFRYNDVLQADMIPAKTTLVVTWRDVE